MPRPRKPVSPFRCFSLSPEVSGRPFLVLHRSRELLVRQRTMLINAIRGHCAEFGLISAQGVSGIRDLVERVDAV